MVLKEGTLIRPSTEAAQEPRDRAQPLFNGGVALKIVLVDGGGKREGARVRSRVNTPIRAIAQVVFCVYDDGLCMHSIPFLAPSLLFGMRNGSKDGSSNFVTLPVESLAPKTSYFLFGIFLSLRYYFGNKIKIVKYLRE